MNARNRNVRDLNRNRATIQNQIRLTQTFDSANNHVNGFRSLGFYQSKGVETDASIAIAGRGGKTVGP